MDVDNLDYLREVVERLKKYDETTPGWRVAKDMLRAVIAMAEILLDERANEDVADLPPDLS